MRMTAALLLLYPLRAAQGQLIQAGSNATCTPCPAQAEKCIGNDIYLKRGYWRKSNLTFYIHRCPYSSSCLGGGAFGDQLCAEGAEGPLCACCADGYYKETNMGRCLKCPRRSSAVLLVILALATFTLLAIIPAAHVAFHMCRQDVGAVILEKANVSAFVFEIYVFFLRPKGGVDGEEYLSLKAHVSALLQSTVRRLVPKLKIVISFFQIVSAFRYVLLMSYDGVDGFDERISAISRVVNLSLGVGLECHYAVDYVDYLLIVTVTPLAAAASLYLVYGIHSLLLERKDDSVDPVPLQLEAQYMWMFLCGSYLILPIVSIVIMQVFSCDNVDPDDVHEGDNYYMRADYTISCTSTRYRLAQGISVLMGFIYPIGVPMLYLYVSNVPLFACLFTFGIVSCSCCIV